DREVDNTLLQELELRCLRACESPAPEVVRDLNASLRPILDGRGKPISRAAPRGVLARDDGHLELGLELRGERTSRQKASGYDEEEGCVFHGYILMQHEATLPCWHPCHARDDRHYQ